MKTYVSFFLSAMKKRCFALRRYIHIDIYNTGNHFLIYIYIACVILLFDDNNYKDISKIPSLRGTCKLTHSKN